MLRLCLTNLRECQWEKLQRNITTSIARLMKEGLSSNWKSAELSIPPRSVSYCMLALIVAYYAPHQSQSIAEAWSPVPTDCAPHVQVSTSKNTFDMKSMQSGCAL